METYAELLRAQSQLDMLIQTNDVIGRILIIVILIGGIALAIFFWVTTEEAIMSIFTLIVMIAGLAWFMYDLSVSDENYAQQKQELEAFIKEYKETLLEIETYQEISTKTIPVEQIIEKSLIYDIRCFDSIDTGSCYIVEFISGDDVYQTIVPMDRKIYANLKDGATLTYFDLTEGQLQTYFDYKELKKMNFTNMKVKFENFLIGSSISNE